MINGALTIGTLDGANVEMREEAGAENFFCPGLTVPEVERLVHDGYHPSQFIESNTELRAGAGSHLGRRSRTATSCIPATRRQPHPPRPVPSLADFADYLVCQNEVSDTCNNGAAWDRMSISTPLAAASSRRIGPSRSTATTSGTSSGCQSSDPQRGGLA